MNDKIVKSVIIALAIAVLVVLVLYFTSQQTITGFHNPVVSTTNSQFLYNIHTLTPIQSISVNFSMTPVPNSATPADGIQIILGSNNVKFIGGVFKCRIQGNCPPPGAGSLIPFSGIMAGIEVLWNESYSGMSCAPDLFICSNNGQCYTTPIPKFNQPISGTLTVNVSSNSTQATLQLSNGQVYTVTAPLGIKTNVAEVSVTTGDSYAIWNLNSITIKSSII